jgi:RNA polymerase sigma factor (sigma-70 family)
MHHMRGARVFERISGVGHEPSPEVVNAAEADRHHEHWPGVAWNHRARKRAETKMHARGQGMCFTPHASRAKYTARLGVVISQLRRALQQEATTDGELLGKFVERRDEAAFEALVRRHGPMVFGVCRRLLCHVQDAEDAFQATWLVLVRRAPSIVDRHLLGNWLYGVACRTALEARVKNARRRKKELHVEPRRDSEAVWQDFRPLLDRELSHLPDKYRVPIVLCDLEGRSRKEAARQLQIPEGTLSSRLATARKTLAERLTRRGLVLSAPALALSQAPASAALRDSLVASAVRSAALVAAGQASLAISSDVTALAEKVIRTMILVKLKTPILLATVLLGALAAGIAHLESAAPQASAASQPNLTSTRVVVPAWVIDEGKRNPMIISVNPRTGAWKKLAGEAISVRVSPDGQTVAFVADGVWNCDAGGSNNPGKLFDSSAYDAPAWSGDGNVDGTGSKKVFSEAGTHVEGCCWSPDGQRLAVVVADLIPHEGKMLIPYGREDGQWRIELMDADGQNRSRLPLKASVNGLRAPDWFSSE